MGGLSDISSAVAPVADIAGVATTGVPWGSIASAGIGMAGGMMNNNANANQARMANEFSAQQYATRYQTQVEDLKKAGLNPMLAYTQGAGSAPQGQQARMENVATPAIDAYNNTAKTSMEFQKLEPLIKQVVQETLTSATQADLNEESRKEKSTNIKLLVEQVVNAKTDNARIVALTKLLGAQKGLTDASAKKVGQDYNIDRPDEIINSSPYGVPARVVERGTNTAKALADKFPITETTTEDYSDNNGYKQNRKTTRKR
jgi:hypothetical protein